MGDLRVAPDPAASAVRPAEPVSAERISAALELRGASRNVTIAPPVLLAPMEGITDALFRELLCAPDLNGGGLGGVCSEFIRITTGALSPRLIARQLGVAAHGSVSGAATHGVPVAVQLMASSPDHVGASAAAAAQAGAAWVDLNFGCPAPTVCGHGAGSALLCQPAAIHAIIAAARSGTGLPVTAKVRVGIDNDRDLERIVLTCADAGAAAITVHARLRVQSYAQAAHWPWIAQAQAILDRAGHRLPVIGNGSIETPADITRMRAETGCAAVMVGRAALANPFLFRVAAGGAMADGAEARAFISTYAAQLMSARGAHSALPRLKQLIRWYRIDPELDVGDTRAQLLRADLPTIMTWLGHRSVSA